MNEYHTAKLERKIRILLDQLDEKDKLLEQAERRCLISETNYGYAMERLEQAELDREHGQRLLEVERYDREQAERERDEALGRRNADPFFGKHSWDELIHEAAETHERSGAYGTLYLRLAEALRAAEAQLAKVPALVEALNRIRHHPFNVMRSDGEDFRSMKGIAIEALAKWEQAQGATEDDGWTYSEERIDFAPIWSREDFERKAREFVAGEQAQGREAVRADPKEIVTRIYQESMQAPGRDVTVVLTPHEVWTLREAVMRAQAQGEK